MTFPDPKRIGTYNQIDRSKQYTRADNGELLRSLNEAWSKIRSLEATNLRKDAVIAELHSKVRRYRTGYTVFVSIITGLAWEGLRALVPIAVRIFR